MTDSIESRVATLEERARAQSELNHQLFGKLDAIVAALARLETATALSAARACPVPGKCLELQSTIERLSEEAGILRDKVEALEGTAAEARGGWKVLALVAGAAGTVGSGIGWLVSHLTSKGNTP
jgi:L-serine deaminase